MQEIAVVRRVRHYLQQHGLLNQQVYDLYTDAHPTLLADPGLQPFQRFALSFDHFTVHPDLVGRLTDGEATFAIEAKGTTDLLKGFAQAEIYRAGFHLVLLAYAGEPSRDLLALARRFDVGVLTVLPDRVDMSELPIPHLPQLQHARSIRRQFTATASLTQQFYFNMPTHAFAAVQSLALSRTLSYQASDELVALEGLVRLHYPVLPRGRASFRSALAEAEKLGLVQIQGPKARLTHVGAAASELLPDLPTLSLLHQQVVSARSGATLAGLNSDAAAVLRLLLLQEPIVRFLVEVLSTAGRGPLPMPALVAVATELDKDLTPTIFFKPEIVPQITDDQGHLVWRQIASTHYRTTIYMQWKSWLKHAGLIQPHRLGGTSAQTYRPDLDLWELAADK